MRFYNGTANRYFIRRVCNLIRVVGREEEGCGGGGGKEEMEQDDTK